MAVTWNVGKIRNVLSLSRSLTLSLWNGSRHLRPLIEISFKSSDLPVTHCAHDFRWVRRCSSVISLMKTSLSLSNVCVCVCACELWSVCCEVAWLEAPKNRATLSLGVQSSAPNESIDSCLFHLGFVIKHIGVCSKQCSRIRQSFVKQRWT